MKNTAIVKKHGKHGNWQKTRKTRLPCFRDFLLSLTMTCFHISLSAHLYGMQFVVVFCAKVTTVLITCTCIFTDDWVYILLLLMVLREWVSSFLVARQHVLGIDDSAACDSANSAACGSVHVVKESALILMQTVPTHIQVAELKKKLIKNVRLFICLHKLLQLWCFA